MIKSVSGNTRRSKAETPFNGNLKKRLTTISSAQFKRVKPIPKCSIITNQFQNIFTLSNNDNQLLNIVRDALEENKKVFIKKNNLIKPLVWAGDSEKNTFFHMLAQFGSDKVINNVIDLAVDPVNRWLRSTLISQLEYKNSSNGFTFFHLFLQRGKYETIIKVLNLACDPSHKWLRDGLCAPVLSSNIDWNGYSCFHMAARFSGPAVISTILLLAQKMENSWLLKQLDGQKINFYQLIDKFCSSKDKSEIIKIISKDKPLYSTDTNKKTIQQAQRINKLDNINKNLVECIILHKKKEEYLEFLRESLVTDVNDLRGYADESLQRINKKIEQLEEQYLK